MLLPTGAQAQTVYTVQMGQDIKGTPGFSARFYPPAISVHKGDTIQFKGGAPFVLPAGTSPQEWAEESASKIDDPYGTFVADPDDAPGKVKINPVYVFPLDCGTADNPCVANGNDLFNSGLFAEGPLSITIDANPGDVLYAIGAPWTQNPSSSMRIDVVGNNETASTQAELDQRASKLKARDVDTARALDAKYSTKQTKHKDAKGRNVWDAWAGVDQGPVTMLAMYPAELNIDKGDRVQWHFDLNNEPHSVALPFDKAKQVAFTNFSFACDPDGDQAPGPDTAPTSQEPPFCASLDQLEVEFPGAAPHGDGVVKNANDYEDSGFHGPEVNTGGFFSQDPYTLTFNTTTDAKGIKYLCTFHGPFMRGAVVVK
jgi:plastocyanin